MATTYPFSKDIANFKKKIKKLEEPEAYKEAYEEAQRIIRISEESHSEEKTNRESKQETETAEKQCNKISSSKLAEKMGGRTSELLEYFTKKDYLETLDEKKYITEIGVLRSCIKINCRKGINWLCQISLDSIADN